MLFCLYNFQNLKKFFPFDFKQLWESLRINDEEGKT